MKNKALLIIALISFTVLLTHGTSFGQRPGIECGCTKYGYYKPPSLKPFKIYIGDTPDEAYSSKTKRKYRLVLGEGSTPGNALLNIYFEGSQVFSENTSATTWGFSPDEDKFVMNGLDQYGKNFCRLVNLNPQSGIDGEPAVAEDLISVSVSYSAIKFSPNGKYLLYAAIDHSGDLILKIFNASNFQEVYDASGTRLIGNLQNKQGIDSWGFSPDSKNETFMFTYLTDIDEYTVTVKNLKSPAGEYVLDAEGVQGESYFAFSPCGDYFGWLYGSTVSSPEARFYRTGENHPTPIIREGGGVRQFSAHADGHYLVYNFLNDSTNIFANTSGETCPDVTKPTWPGGASLVANEIRGASVTLGWSSAEDIGGVSGYRIYKVTKGELLKEIDNTNECEITGLTPAATYRFKVEAGDEAGNWSTTGPEVEVTTQEDAAPEWQDGELTFSNDDAYLERGC